MMDVWYWYRGHSSWYSFEGGAMTSQPHTSLVPVPHLETWNNLHSRETGGLVGSQGPDPSVATFIRCRSFSGSLVWRGTRIHTARTWTPCVDADNEVLSLFGTCPQHFQHGKLPTPHSDRCKPQYARHPCWNGRFSRVTLVSLGVRLVSLGVTFLSLGVTFVSLMFAILDVTFVSMGVTFISLDVTLSSLGVTFQSLDVTFVSRDVTFQSLNVTKFWTKFRPKKALNVGLKIFSSTDTTMISCR